MPLRAEELQFPDPLCNQAVRGSIKPARSLESASVMRLRLAESLGAAGVWGPAGTGLALVGIGIPVGGFWGFLLIAVGVVLVVIAAPLMFRRQSHNEDGARAAPVQAIENSTAGRDQYQAGRDIQVFHGQAQAGPAIARREIRLELRHIRKRLQDLEEVGEEWGSIWPGKHAPFAPLASDKWNAFGARLSLSEQGYEQIEGAYHGIDSFNRAMERGPRAFQDPEPNSGALADAIDAAIRALDLAEGNRRTALRFGTIEYSEPALKWGPSRGGASVRVLVVPVANDPPPGVEGATAQHVCAYLTVVLPDETRPISAAQARWQEPNQGSRGAPLTPAPATTERDLPPNGSMHRINTVMYLRRERELRLFTVDGPSTKIRADSFTLEVRVRGSNVDETERYRITRTTDAHHGFDATHETERVTRQPVD